MTRLLNLRGIAAAVLIVSVGHGGCGGRSDSAGTGTGGAAAGSGGDASGGSGGGPAATGGVTGMAGATGGHAMSGGASGAGMATGGNSGSGGVSTGGKPGSGGAPAGTGGMTGGSGGGKATGGAAGGASAGKGGGTAGSGGRGGAIGGTGGSGGAGGIIAGTGSVTITPGTVWNDTQGNVIQAHGEGIIEVDGKYYLLGEDKTNGSAFQNVKCYASTDLKNWTFVSNVLTRQASGDLGPNRIIERPHVIYNSGTSQFVMYMHVDSSDYSDRKAGVATSSTVCGSYTYRGSMKPLGHDSLDDTLFQDGTAGYFISEDRTNTKLQIYRLSDDYLTVSTLAATVPQYESPAVVKIGSTYFLFGSHLTGWSTNDNQYSTASSMTGPWSSWKSFAPSGTNTCNSQTAFILPVVGSSTTTYVLLADRWNSSNLADSRYIWLPLTISGTTVSTTCATSWKIDTSTGAWSP
jgi:glycosyl hydrolase family 43